MSEGYDLISDNTCNFNSARDRNNTDPMLRPLQLNGGPTETMAPQPGSPAMDAGNPRRCTGGYGHALTIDQRGHKRPGDPALITSCDIGAFELQHLH